MEEAESIDGSFASSDSEQLLQWMQRKLFLLHFPVSQWTSQHADISLAFLSSGKPAVLFVCQSPDSGFQLVLSSPQMNLSGRVLGYFFRRAEEIVGPDNVSKCVSFGTVHRRAAAGLQRLVEGLVKKQMGASDALTSGAKTEFEGHYHRFMATLAEAVNVSSGKTVLYTPVFEFGEIVDAAKNKDLVQQVDSIVIHWTKQLKSVLNNHDSPAQAAELSGPLDEINFWKVRADDLLGIQQQLEQPEIVNIISLLEHAKSAYLEQFKALTEQIQRGANEAYNNLKFLETIRPHCVNLRQVAPDEIVNILPELLGRIRLIWAFSQYYNTEQRITGILRKISNETITRFRANIDVPAIFHGNVETCMEQLEGSISCGVQWKLIYKRTVALVNAQKERYGRTWEMDDASIFAQIDAFVQRCRDLIEVCESQIQFCRKSAATGGRPGPLPQFGGTKAKELTDGLLGIQHSFERHVERLNQLDYDILDVKVGKWHDDYNTFKLAVKDLEVMFANVISAAFENLTTISDGVAMLHTFRLLAKRDAIIHCVERKVSELFTTFIAQLQDARVEFDSRRSAPLLRPHEPQFAGSALWAHSIAMNMKTSWEVLKPLRQFYSCREYEEAEDSFMALYNIIREFKLQRYQQWVEHVHSMVDTTGLQSRLERPLFRRVTAEGGRTSEIICNFDEDLLALFAEVGYWEKFQSEFSIPYVAHDICNKREQLRVMREHVMLVVRAYNDILRDLEADERRLFADHVRRLDRRISQGATKLNWQSKNVIEMYARDCVQACSEIHATVREFKATKVALQRHVRSMQSISLLQIERNVLYEQGVFEQRQELYRSHVRKTLSSTFQNMLASLRSVYRHFREGSVEVQREWKSQVNTIDRNIEQALKATTKRSLQELSRAINGDSKNDPQTLFTVRIVLENSQAEYSPNLVNLTHSVNLVIKELIGIVSAIPRLREQQFDVSAESETSADGNEDGASTKEDQTTTDMAAGAAAAPSALGADGIAADTINIEKDSRLPTYHHIISNDNDVLRFVVQIMNGMSSSATELQKFLTNWDKYKAIWEMDKEAFIRKYAKANRSPAQFDTDIGRYRDQQTEIQNEVTSQTINFVKVDCSYLKDALIDHCLQCQTKLANLLNDNGLAELNSVYSLFQTTAAKLQKTPANLNELSASIELLQDARRQLPDIQARFEPIREVYATLAKAEVQIDEVQSEMLNNLDTEFEAFQTMLCASEKVLDKTKLTMKRELEGQMDSYSHDMHDLRQKALAQLPYNADADPGAAMEMIAAYKAKIAGAQQVQQSLTTGFAVFGMQQAEFKDIADTVRDLELLESVWTVTTDWQMQWSEWKTGQFEDLDVGDMENTASLFSKKIVKLGREIKRWPVWERIRDEVERFKKTMPLIQDLRTPALRPRHWAEVRERLGVDFDPASADFTLEKVFALGFNAHADFIAELSANANKELAIEESIDALEVRWDALSFELQPYKEHYYKFKTSEELIQTLEDDTVALSTMKASKFYPAFAARIDAWEHALSAISEVIESLQGLQRKWMYLESIFMGTGDISRQLPTEFAMFAEVNTQFVELLSDMHEHPNARWFCTRERIVQELTSMDNVLERVQKSLDQYLETKRMLFPRFYFISDDDLLEILGQSKNPAAVQKHIKKCFEGIKVLELVSSGSNANRVHEAIGMKAPDGEKAEFVDHVLLDGPVELWLKEVEKAMVRGMQKLLMSCLLQIKTKKEKWIKEWQGQLLITAGAITWTADCTKALNLLASGTKNALRSQKSKQVSYLNKIIVLVRGVLSPVDRLKVVALITMEIHNRDVIERMMKANCTSVHDFEWLSQVRYLFEKDVGEFGQCVVKQTNSTLEYSYEYQGNNGRLVVTPLTDRCVLTLTTAMYLNRGGNPLGPAGTGKTETVKDLGKNLAKYVVVINCSDGMDYKSVGRIFSGLVQSGSWGCFDEFNRIKIEVISVVAMQVATIFTALSAKQSHVWHMGQQIACNKNCGIFITMNPGYAGRTELPDNLKALMRPVAMMVPDLVMIAEVMLAAEGFTDARTLAKKTVTLYSLMIQQLSKQDHYDYGLRNLKAVLTMAGALKRQDSSLSEEMMLMRALRDMNIPKFIKEDERLFRLLLGDLFPNLELPQIEHQELKAALEEELQNKQLQPHPFLLTKIAQLYDSKQTRHCNMLVGQSYGGKSTTWQTLAAAMGRLSKDNPAFQPVQHVVINPKAVELDELYGAYNLATFEWHDGIFSTIFKSMAESEKPEEKWIVFDGPVDALWIESMNSVMDDNRILTLINGDRIPLTPSMSLLFEVEDLSVASPATVSRAGMIYLDASELGWRVFVETWLKRRFKADQNMIQFHWDLFDKYVTSLLAFKASHCREPVTVADFNAVMTLCCLYDKISATAEVDMSSDTTIEAVLEKVFVFCVTWSVLASVDEVGRQRCDTALRDIEPLFPPTGKVYDYVIDISKNDFVQWESKVPSWRATKEMTFHDMIVPTTDTVRTTFIVETLRTQGRHVLVVGQTGTGKTVMIQSLLSALPDTHSQLTINFSAATSSQTVQSAIEGVMEKRAKDKMGPIGGKRLLVFIDDLNMPRLTSAESPFQPPLELLRLLVDYSGWYDRAKCAWRTVLDTQLVAAMGPPGGGRNEISNRFKSCFSLVNFTFPGDLQITRIFDSILQANLAEYDVELRSMSLTIVTATLQVYKHLCSHFLPTPEKFHYAFNLRDVAKVIQGVSMAGKQSVFTLEGMLRLWVHECQRVFSDQFVHDDAQDETRFRELLMNKLTECFSQDWGNVMHDAMSAKTGPLFSAVLSQPESEALVYEEFTDMNSLRATIEERLEDYNSEAKVIAMNLVLFTDAIHHVCRIHRILIQPRGNAMLIGVGGSGRQSLARLAAYIAGYQTFSIQITKHYRINEFREDLKSLFRIAGCENRNTMFLFNDNQIKDELFLEDINNILSTGEVPNLFAKDEIVAIFDAIRSDAAAVGADDSHDKLWRFFISRVRAKLHIVLAVSPIGSALRNRCRMYPGLVNCTTMDWFQPWPVDALQEVASHFLSHLQFQVDSYRPAIAKLFSEMHASVVETSELMKVRLKRYNYVTPTNYLALVKGYQQLLVDKSNELSSSANKLANGLAKLEEARVQVQQLTIELEEKKVVVAQSQKDCEDLLVEIVSERRAADESRRQVESDSERIGKEEEECKAIAADAEADLAVALPALERAMEEVNKLDKSAISEVKAYAKPPKQVDTVLSAVMILLGKAGDWKKVISDANFLQQIKTFDKDNISPLVINKIRRFIEMPDFNAEEVRKVSVAAAALCVWVHAMFVYANVYREVAPKKQRLRDALDGLEVKQAALREAQHALAVITQRVEDLKRRYDDSVAQKTSLHEEAAALEDKLDRAAKLVAGLEGEYVRWQQNIQEYNKSLTRVVGDAVMASGYLSYAGPFEASYRSNLISLWLKALQKTQLPFSPEFEFTTFLAKPTDVRDWNIQGLPSDKFSIENGVIVTRGDRWPLMIDPQGQANRWIRNMEGSDLRVIDLKMKDFLRDLENAVRFGMPVLLQDVLEELDPALEPVLARQIVKLGNREVIVIGDKEVDYSRDFRLYITTKLANPHYTPEISTKTAVVNFSVKREGLEGQLLGIVVQREEPELEQQKSALTVRVAAGKKRLVELEDNILRLLTESTGSLLDDLELINTLQASKVTSEDVTEQLRVAEETERKIDTAREAYRPTAVRAAIAYFVLDDMSRVDPMYQSSLDAYVDLFCLSIESSKTHNPEEMTVQKRCENINVDHTAAVYRYMCRGLFERHKLLFSFQFCLKIMMEDNKVPMEDLNFLCYGPPLVNRALQRRNPSAEWISEAAWDSITELEKLPGLQGLAASFEQMNREWKAWYLHPKLENEPLPGEWVNKCSPLQHICLIRALRPDRMTFAVTEFVSTNLGPSFVDPPMFDLQKVFATSNAKSPLIFVLSPGVDPAAQVTQLAQQVGVKMDSCALGQGQGPVAMQMLENGLRTGSWVFLANCHLMLSWMPVLEKKIEEYCLGAPHERFRLWLSSAPDPKFPISILQKGIKMTTEPPRGLRSNLAKLYNTLSEEPFNRCSQPSAYRRLLFSLAWFHAILLERRKFKSLGFNIPYDFNESDFAICHDLIIVLLDENREHIPFDAMTYLIAEANYGGRVTDDWDRRLVNVYVSEFFCEGAVQHDGFPLCELPEYRIPEDGELQSYKDFIKSLPTVDQPGAFGQHPNADIASQIDDANELITTLGSIQAGSSQAADVQGDSQLAKQCADLLAQLPELFDYQAIKQALEGRSDPEPMKIILLQEIIRYNVLLQTMTRTLQSIQRVLQGLEATTAELEEVVQSLQASRVPQAWSHTYPSLKPLGSWVRDLLQRLEQLSTWAVTKGYPTIFWMPGFTYPAGFLTAVLQTTARKNGMPIDQLSWDYVMLNHLDVDSIHSPPKEGVYVYGLVLEGACWNFEGTFLEEARPMELLSPMPIIHFKPVEGRKKNIRGFYSCPLYMYPIRSGSRERPSFVVAVELKVGKFSADFWTKRGVGLLLSTAL